MGQWHGRVTVLLLSVWNALLLDGGGVAEAVCVPLSGIEAGGGEGKLDLNAVSVSLEEEPFFLSNPLVPAIASCSKGLEGPISMRNLLGERRLFEACDARYGRSGGGTF